MTDAIPWWMWIVGFLAVLGPLVTVHELGHYLVGRWFGVKANAFSIGFGKELVGWTDKRGTRWKIAALPLGGYVQFAGDMDPSSRSVENEEWLALPEQERAQTFQAKTLWQRALIVAAGPFTNFAVAVLILGGFAYAYGDVVIPPRVAAVEENGAAMAAGVQPGDEITAIDGKAIGSFLDLRNHVVMHPGESIRLGLEREGRAIELDFTIPALVEKDRFGNEYRKGYLGVQAVPGELVPVGPIEAIGVGVSRTGEILAMGIDGLGQIITGRRPVSELGGPLKIAKFSGERLSLGWQSFVEFAAFISINLAFINLLPIPALDGGHLAFYAAEAIRRKPLGPRSQEWAFRTGIAFVLALMLFVTINDLVSLTGLSSG
ncbi:RIP metalloprotease RseP [Altererythrobacter sp. CAU 1778]